MYCALSVKDLVVKYGDKIAVNKLSFCIKPGEVYCLLGPNGAGKTSTIKAVLGLVEWSGEIDILGMGPPKPEIMNHMGVIMETPLLLESLTPRDFLEFVGSVRGVRDEAFVEALIRAFEIEDLMNKPITTLSAGNKQKIAIISALMHKPRLLLMDEPFNYLDAKSVRVLKELMYKHVHDEGSILFTTHIMDVAERVCHRVCIINNGVKIMEGTVEEVMKETRAGTLEEAFLKSLGADEEVKHIIDGLL